MKKLFLSFLSVLLVAAGNPAYADIPSIDTEAGLKVLAPVQAEDSSSDDTVTENQSQYLLGPGDVLSVIDYSSREDTAEQALQNVAVSPDGMANVYPVGMIKASGRTIQQFNQELNTRAKKYLINPSYVVSVASYRPAFVYVLGEVANPGLYGFGDNGGGMGSVSQNFRGLDRLSTSSPQRKAPGEMPKRTGGQGLADVLTQTPAPAFLPGGLGAMATGIAGLFGAVRDAPQDAPAAPLTNVPKGMPGMMGMNGMQGMSYANAMPTSLPTVPGGNFDPSHLTILTALERAGGVRDSANIRQVRIRRPSTNQTFYCDLWQLLVEGDPSQDIAIQPGDTVYVPAGGLNFNPEALGNLAANHSRRVRILGMVKQPGLYELSANDDMYSLLARAGGFTPTARTGSVLLSRVNRDGTVFQKRIAVNGSLKDSESVARSPVQNGDVIVVNNNALRSLLPYTLKTLAVTVGAMWLIYFSNQIKNVNVQTGADANNSNVRVLAF